MEDYIKTVSIKINDFTAKRITALAKQGGFGTGLKKSNLDAVVRVIINKQVMAADRRLIREKLAMQKAEKAQRLLSSGEISKQSLEREKLTVKDILLAAAHNGIRKGIASDMKLNNHQLR